MSRTFAQNLNKTLAIYLGYGESLEYYDVFPYRQESRTMNNRVVSELVTQFYADCVEKFEKGEQVRTVFANPCL